MNHQFDLVIIGGGMVGSALCAALADVDLSIALIETQMPAATDTPIHGCHDVDMRVSALNRASEQFLDAIKSWEKIPKNRKCAYDKMRVWDGEGTGHIQFDANTLQEPYLGNIVENRFTASALMALIQQQKNVHIFSPATVKEIEELTPSAESSSKQVQYFIQLDNEEIIYAPMVVAADGARSFVRSWAEFDTREWDYQHHGLVCTIETQLPHEDCAWQRFTEDGVLAFLPLPSGNNKHFCSIVWSCPENRAQQLLALSEKEFNTELEKAFESKLGQVISSAQRAAIPLRQRHAKRYVRNGIVLVGDAAHTIHPLAGQGVNLGLMDAYVLADEIKQGLARGLAPHNDQLLARYERRRMPENLTMMATMESFKRLFSVKTPVLRWARNWGMNKMNGLDFLKNHVVQQAMGSKRKIR